MNRGELELRLGQVPSINATVCLAESAIITDLFQLSKFIAIEDA